MVRNEAWFDRLYERHRRAVLAFCLRRSNADDAEDVMAQVFAVAWRRRNDVPSGDATLPWLYGVARNVLSHQWRADSRFRRLAGRAVAGLDPSPPDPEHIVVENEEYVRVRLAVSELKVHDREVLLLSAWEGLSHADIAGILGCSTAAIDKRLQRAKRRLRKQYEARSQARALRPPASVKGGEGS
jgi:RNA polymerase sigma-70 factor (ECF subfamily)